MNKASSVSSHHHSLHQVDTRNGLCNRPLTKPHKHVKKSTRNSRFLHYSLGTATSPQSDGLRLPLPSPYRPVIISSVLLRQDKTESSDSTADSSSFNSFGGCFCCWWLQNYNLVIRRGVYRSTSHPWLKSTHVQHTCHSRLNRSIARSGNRVKFFQVSRSVAFVW